MSDTDLNFLYISNRELKAIINTALYSYYKRYVEQLEKEHNELLRENIQLEKKVTRWRNKYNEAKNSNGNDLNHREMCKKLVKERDAYKEMYLKIKNELGGMK